MLNGRKEVKWGIVLSYILVFLNTAYGLFLTPYMVSQLGEAEYGVYKTIASLTASLMVLDLGIGGTVMRFIAKFKAEKEDHKIPNFIAMSVIQVGLLGLLIIGVGAVVFNFIGPTYSKTFTDAQLERAKVLYCVLILNMVLNVFENVINGIITGYNHFIFSNGAKMVRLITRIFLVFLLLQFYKNSVAIVLVDTAVILALLAVEFIYIFSKLKIKIKLTHWDNQLFLVSGKYTLLMFLTSIAAQVNNNLDNVIIGAEKGPELVAIYSFGLLIFTMYENLSTSVSGVLLPTVTDVLAEENGDKRVCDIIVKAGRIQFAMLGAAVVGFFCIGKGFVNLWLGDGYSDVYIITLILMVPSLFELCVNVCLTVLRAKNMLFFRTAILAASTVLNAVVTILLVRYWSYIGAAIGTAMSFIVGSLIIMNIYYKKKLNFPMLSIYGRIFSRIWICLLVSGAVLYVSSKYITGGWLAFIVNVAIFGVVYLITLLAFGFNDEEKQSLPVVKNIVNRIKR